MRSLVVTLALSLPSFVGVAHADPVAAERDVGAELAAYAGSKKQYRAIRKDVLAWHKTSKNGCVAYASTALRHIGVNIPLRGVRDGWGVSRITFAFSDHLEKELSWTRVAMTALRPGDLVFTTGAPDHVFIFHSWASERRRVARAIDNQGHKHRRPLKPGTSSRLAAFAYALRAP